MMKYYKDKDGNVFAFEEDGSQDEYIGNKQKMSDEEVNAHLYQSHVNNLPNKVTRRQARRALLQAGLLNQVDAAINSIQDELTRESMRIDWQDATEFKRDDQTLNTLAAALNLTNAQLDQLFIEASKF